MLARATALLFCAAAAATPAQADLSLIPPASGRADRPAVSVVQVFRDAQVVMTPLPSKDKKPATVRAQVLLSPLVDPMYEAWLSEMRLRHQYYYWGW